MNDGNKRADAARANDDSDLIDAMEDAPEHGGTAGGNLQRDVASRAEEKKDIGADGSVERVCDSDKPEEADLPRFNDN